MTSILNLSRLVSIKDTKDNIEDFDGTLSELTVAFAVDSNELGVYTADDQRWHWFSAGGIGGMIVEAPLELSTESPPVLSHGVSGVVAGEYQKVTVNASGHVTAGSNDELAVYGILVNGDTPGPGPIVTASGEFIMTRIR